MEASLLHEFRCRRLQIRARWESLLRAEPVTTPLALPDALVYLMEGTLNEILTALEHPTAESVPVHGHEPSSGCCGQNPFLCYFAAGEQAILEGLVLAQAASTPLDPDERDSSLAELEGVLEHISRREIEAFCGVCQFRHLALPAPAQSLAIQRW